MQASTSLVLSRGARGSKQSQMCLRAGTTIGNNLQ